MLYVINGLGTGGAERSLQEMLPGLLAAGLSPVVTSLNRRTEGVERLMLAEGADVRFLNSGSLPARVRSLRRIILSEKPDVVHTTLFDSSVAGRLASVGVRTKVLTSLVNTHYNQARFADPNVRPLKLKGVKVVDGWTARHLTSHFHAITHAVKEAATRDLGVPGERITVIERGRDVGRLGRPHARRRARSRDALGLDRSAPVLVNVGRQEYQKGQRDLLEAMPAVLARHPRATLLVAGRTGHASAELEQLHRRLGLSQRVRFLGHRDDLPEVLAAADLFVFPSLYEGLGGSLLEAMALGLPIVGTDIPALREVLEAGANAVLVPPASPPALSVAVADLLDETVRLEAFARRSRAIFEERFTLERSTQRMVRLYEDLATGTAREQAG